MLKSFCIKTNNQLILNYLLNQFNQHKPNYFHISKNSFKIYDNIILHYSGTSYEMYYDYIAGLLTNLIIYFYEEKLLAHLIHYNYFYFSEIEEAEILDNCINYLSSNNQDAVERKNIIFHLCKKYIKENKSVIIDGLINFRLKEYTIKLDEILEKCISTYVIEKEYISFINLLKEYIASQESSNEFIHLIYLNNESLLLDNKKNVIHFDTDISNSKYLSDITFSSNDYCLNTLLNILPLKIYIHLIDNEEDEFITTLKLIFGKRIIICSSCDICYHYKNNSISHLTLLEPHKH